MKEHEEDNKNREPKMIDAAKQNLTENPPEILKHISTFLNMRDVLNLQASSKSMKESVGLEVNHNTVPNNLLSAAQWYGTDDETHFWRRIDPIFADKVHSIQITCRFRDQGWGNRKSYLYITEQDESDEDYEKSMGKIICSSHLAEHYLTDVRFEYCPKPGKMTSIWYRVGGGGGHQLVVSHLKIKSLINDPICAKLMSANLCIQDKFFRAMFMAVLQTMSDSVGGAKSNTRFSMLFESIGVTLNGSASQIASMKHFVEEWDRYEVFISKFTNPSRTLPLRRRILHG